MSLQVSSPAYIQLTNPYFSGVPVVKISPEIERTKDAIARARMAVEEDQKDDAAQEVEKKEDTKYERLEKVEAVKADIEPSTSTKREREDDAEVSEAKKSKMATEA